MKQIPSCRNMNSFLRGQRLTSWAAEFKTEVWRNSSRSRWDGTSQNPAVPFPPCHALYLVPKGPLHCSFLQTITFSSNSAFHLAHLPAFPICSSLYFYVKNMIPHKVSYKEKRHTRSSAPRSWVKSWWWLSCSWQSAEVTQESTWQDKGSYSGNLRPRF